MDNKTPYTPAKYLIEANDVTVETEHVKLVRNASLNVSSGEVVALLGPNGAGKTTLLRALLGLTQYAGEVCIAGKAAEMLNAQSRALSVSYLPQNRSVAWPCKVSDIVALGRFAHGVSVGHLVEEDAIQVDQALAACELNDLRNRKVDTLSGGELARVHCARVFAANAPLLVIDEPTAELDPGQQHRILQLLSAYADAHKGVLMVIHDINLALRYATRILCMQSGQLIADVEPSALTAELIANLYGVEAELVQSTSDGIPQVLVEVPR